MPRRTTLFVQGPGVVGRGIETPLRSMVTTIGPRPGMVTTRTTSRLSSVIGAPPRARSAEERREARGVLEVATGP
jgi:hypothetical protein